MSRSQRSRRSKQQQHRDQEQRRPTLVWGWPLPEDLRRALGDVNSNLRTLLSHIGNPALLVQRYIAYPREGEASRARWLWEIRGRNYKNEIWREVEKALGNLYRSATSNKWLKAIHSRIQIAEEMLRCNGFQILTPPVKVGVAWRLVVGMGLPSPMEVGLTLHHLYGFPYLPGSAIKGVTRSWRMQQIADELGIPRLGPREIDEWGRNNPTPWELLERLLMIPKRETWEKLKEALSGSRLKRFKKWGFFDDSEPQLPDFEEIKGKYAQEFSRIFGSANSKGEVLFFDAYPDSLTVGGKPILELDVMTPHYREYYMGEEPPADYLSPTPVLFPVVRKGTSFIIHLASRDPNLMNRTEEWIGKALRNFGLGAKTRAGYGELR